MAVNKVVFGDTTVMDLTEDTVTSDTMLEGVTAHDKSGEQIVGSAVIPTVNNGKLTIQKNGTTVATFTANQSAAATANITVPVKVSELTNDSNFVADKPIFTEASSRANIASGETFATILGKIKKFFTDLKAVAFSGSYNDLSDKPTIPTVNNATLTIQKNGTTVKTFTANASSNVTANITVPTKVSELTNDSGYTTNVGTITGIKMNGASKGTSGVVDLGTVLTAHQSLDPIKHTNTDIPEGAANLNAAATAHKVTAYRNGFTIPYQMDNTNDGGMLRVRGTSESNCILELGTWDDSGGGETIQFNYYPSTSQVTPTHSVSVPKKSGTIALTSDIPDISGKVNKSGDTMTGNLVIQRTGTHDNNYPATLTLRAVDSTNSVNSNGTISAYDGGASGSNMVITPGGNMFIGSGEGALNHYNLYHHNTGEVLYMTSDNQVHIQSNGQTIANRLGLMIDNSGNVLPEKADVATNNSGSIGTSSYKWANGYFTNINGVAVGNSPKFTDTTYSAGTGISLSGTTFSNSGVRDISINGNHLRKNVNGTNTDLTIPFATNSTTASKLGSATVGSSVRGIYLNAGSPTAVSWYPNYCTINGGNKANYPWHRFATCTTGTGQYVDRDVVIILRSRYDTGAYGAIKLSVRTNSTGAAMSSRATWIYRYGFAVGDVVITSGGTTGTDKTFDAWVKCGTYPRRIGYILEGSNNGWTLVNSNEVNDTTATDKKTSTEVFASVSGNVATDGTTVANANTVNNLTVQTAVPANAKFTDTNNAVTQTNTTTKTTNGDYRVLFSATADDTTRTEGARKSTKLTYDPSSGTIASDSVIVRGGALALMTPNTSSNDSADILFTYKDGSEKARIWMDDIYEDPESGPNYRVIGTRVAYVTKLATMMDVNKCLPLTGGDLTGNLRLESGKVLYLSQPDNTKSSSLSTSSVGTLNIHAIAWLNLCTAQQVQCRNATDTAWANIAAANISSSRRFKENIQDLTEEEARKLLDVRTVTFDFKEEYAPSNDWEHERFHQQGVIAEEIKDIYPTLVRYSNYENPDEDPVPTFVEYSHFVPYLIKMIQIQQKEIDDLKVQVKELQTGE